MDLIHYSFAPLILFRVPYTLDFLPYYLSIANGAGVQVFLNFSYFNVLYRSYRVNNKVIDVLYILMYYHTTIFIECSIRVSLVHDTILHISVTLYIQTDPLPLAEMHSEGEWLEHTAQQAQRLFGFVKGGAGHLIKNIKDTSSKMMHTVQHVAGQVVPGLKHELNCIVQSCISFPLILISIYGYHAVCSCIGSEHLQTSVISLLGYQVSFLDVVCF